jgi:hypothetical protein
MIFKHWAFVEGGCLNTGSLDLASSLEDWLCIISGANKVEISRLLLEHFFFCGNFFPSYTSQG